MVLYHATYQKHLPSILQWGLGGAPKMPKRNYEDSRRGVVYLATSADVAVSYAETSDLVPEKWLDEIVVLRIDSTQLDSALLLGDANVLLDPGQVGDTLEYHGPIPVAAIALHSSEEPEDNRPSLA